MEDHRNVGERTGLRVVRIGTNMLTLTGSAAALGIATGASKAGIVGVCLYMAVLALTADWMQHKIRSFRVYTILCFTLVVLTAALGRLVMPLVWIPVGVLGLIEVWSMYESRISERPAFVPHPMGLTGWWGPSAKSPHCVPWPSSWKPALSFCFLRGTIKKVWREPMWRPPKGRGSPTGRSGA